MHPLLRAVLADPESAEKRLVYADFLVERGDPHGSFIQLQCLPNPSSEQLRQAQDLFERHHREWLGPLAPLIARPRFKRGFLAYGKLRMNDFEARRSLPKLRGHPLWATLEGVHVGRYAPEGFDMCVEDELPMLREVCGLWDATQVERVTHGKRRPWTALGFSEVSVVISAARATLRHALSDAPALPHLSRLHLGFQHRPLLDHSLLVKRLGTVRFMYGGWGSIAMRGLTVPRLEFVYRSDWQRGDGWMLAVRQRSPTRLDLGIRRLGRNPDVPKPLVRDVRDLVRLYDVDRCEIDDEVPSDDPPSIVTLKRLLWALSGSAAEPLDRSPSEVSVPYRWLELLDLHERSLGSRWPGRHRVNPRFLIRSADPPPIG